MEKNFLLRRTARGNCFSVVQSKRRKTSLECPPTCVSDTRSYSKAICEQLLRDTIMIPEVTPIPKTRMTTMMMMEKTLNHHRSTCRSTHLPARSFQIQSHFEGRGGTPPGTLTWSSQPLGGVSFCTFGESLGIILSCLC